MKTTRMLFSSATILAVALLAGCSTPTTRSNANPAEYAKLTPEQQALVRSGQPGLGFDMGAVKLALGNPDSVSTIETREGIDTVWHYVSYEADGYPLYTGFYHSRYGWWGRRNSFYYLDYPNRQIYERFRVIFHEGRVSAIAKGDV